MMRCVCLVLLIFEIINTSRAALQCDSADDTYSCTRSAIIAIDATTNMGSYQNIRAEFDFIETWILSRMDIRQGFVGVGMTAYGTGSTTIYDFSYNKPQICTNIEKLYGNVNFETAGNVPLTRTMRNLFNNFGFDHTSLVLFTADMDQSDVDAAASQVHYYIDSREAVGFSIVVVNYGNCSFSKWPQSQTDVYDALTTEPDQLSNYIDESVCAPALATTTSTSETTVFKGETKVAASTADFVTTPRQVPSQVRHHLQDLHCRQQA